MNAGTDYSSSYRSNVATEHTRLVLAKVGAMVILGVGSLMLGMLPLVIGRFGKYRDRDESRAVSRGSSSSTSDVAAAATTSSQGLVTSLLLCFGGGVLLFTTFLHLAPEVRESVERHQSKGQLTNLGTLSMAELLFCVGFFFVYLVEETVDATLAGESETSKDLLYRTVSVRRSGNRPTPTSPTTRNLKAERNNETNVATAIDRSKANNNNILERGIFVRSRNSIEQSGSTVQLAASSSRSSSRTSTIDGLRESQGGRARKDIGTTETTSSVRGLMTVVALSFHAIFEGLAVGLEPSITSVVYLATAIATHKLVIAFCVGMELHGAGASSKRILGYLSIFSLVSPLGIAVGIALGHLNNDTDDNLGPTPTILQGMAAGTLLYVVFFEVLARERANDKSGLLQLVAIILGFMLMLGLQLATPHGHSHGHTHDEHHHHGHNEEVTVNESTSYRQGQGPEIASMNMSEAIERITESVAEAVSNAIATSTEAKLNDTTST